MTQYMLDKSYQRGHANHGWLDTYHTFSFAHYYNKERIHFGALRVLNDDTIAPGTGFGTHPHDNMEIISIPLEGALEHKDSMGNTQVIVHGDIQVMSAGTGIMHSEKNHHSDRTAKFLQIWVFPHTLNVPPRYDQITLNLNDRTNRFQQILSPSPDDEGVWIHQDAWFHLGRFDEGKSAVYSFKKENNGVYVFLLSGSATVDNYTLEARDGIGISGASSFNFTSLAPGTELLIMEVPLEFQQREYSGK